MKHRILTISTLMLSAIAALPQSPASVNPAVNAVIPAADVTTVSAGFGHSLGDEAETLEKGRGHNLGDITVSTKRVMKKGGTAWGGASFTTGLLRDIRFNSAADYSRVAPYVVGDSVGGNRSMQQYTFNGGYAHRLGSRMTWGADFTYRADIEHRNRDPRVKNIVSDFRLTGGLTYALGKTYAMGANAGLLLYSQDSDIKFFNPMNDIYEHVMIGAGSTYARFYGSTSSSAYKGVGATTAIQFFPTGKNMRHSLQASVRFDFNDIDFILRDYNDLTLANAKDYFIAGSLSAKVSPSDVVSLLPTVQIRWTRRLGTENIFGTATGNNYPIIGSRQFFMRGHVGLSFCLPTAFSFGNGLTLNIAPSLEYVLNEARYRLPLREFKVSHLSSGGRIATEKRFNSALIGIYIGFGYTHAHIIKRHFEGMDLNLGAFQAIDHNFRMLSAHRVNKSAGINAEVPLKHSKHAIFFSADYINRRFNEHGAYNDINLRLGYKF